jgi:RimJ/RimL family protein N-acetyltransferase
MSYYKKVTGKKCYLSPICMEDAEIYTHWLNDVDVSINLDMFSKNLAVPNEREFLEAVLRNSDSVFGIIDNKTNRLIGNCGLLFTDWVNRNAEFGIFIGDKSYWGKGFGKEATMLILDYGFNVLNLHNIFLRVYSFNKNAIKLYEKCGFKIIGKRREARLISGKKYDIIFMDILSDEYKSIFYKDLVEKKLK